MDEQAILTPHAFTGSDVERINQALQAAAGTGRRVVIPRRNRAADGDREVWLLDTAILVPGDTVLELDSDLLPEGVSVVEVIGIVEEQATVWHAMRYQEILREYGLS